MIDLWTFPTEFVASHSYTPLSCTDKLLIRSTPPAREYRGVWRSSVPPRKQSLIVRNGHEILSKEGSDASHLITIIVIVAMKGDDIVSSTSIEKRTCTSDREAFGKGIQVNSESFA